MKMIKYCYCKTRPLKIPSVCGGDVPEQEAGLVEPLDTKCCHTRESCFNMNVWSHQWSNHRQRSELYWCPHLFDSYQQTLVDAEAALSESFGSGIFKRASSSRPGPAGCQVSATHLNCFTYMYIFIQVMPVQCIILPTRKINTHDSFFFSNQMISHWKSFKNSITK